MLSIKNKAKKKKKNRMSSTSSTTITATIATNKIPLCLDIETSDPDDVLMLILACSHPRINLKSVTLTPGTREQVALVQIVLNHIFPHGHSISIGAFDPKHGDPEFHDGKRTTCVSVFHFKAFAHIGFNAESRFVGDVKPGWQVLSEQWSSDTKLVTGAPLKNLGKFLESRTNTDSVRKLTWICQGGFAGSNVVPAERQMSKFRNLEYCDTYNLCGDLRSAKLALESELLRDAIFISKNVCHSVEFDADRLKQLNDVVTSMEDSPRFRSLSLVHHAMQIYLDKRAGGGKKFHDPLALCCAIDSSLFELARVKLVHRKGEGFGCELSSDATTLPHHISVACDKGRCFALLFER